MTQIMKSSFRIEELSLKELDDLMGSVTVRSADDLPWLSVN